MKKKKKQRIISITLIVIAIVLIMGIVGYKIISKVKYDQSCEEVAIDEHDIKNNDVNANENKARKNEEIDAIEVFEKLFQNEIDGMPNQSDIDILLNVKYEDTTDAFIGEWRKTQCEMGESGYIKVENNDSYSATVTGGFDSYGSSGNLNENGDTAYYVSDKYMVVKEIEEWDENEITLFLFAIDGDQMEVIQYGHGNMGAGVSARGTYTKGEPEYTNANVIDENFTAQEQASIKTLIEKNGLDYEERFIYSIEYGYFETSTETAAFADGSIQNGTWYESMSPHGFTAGSTIFIGIDGNIYYETGYGEKQFITTNSAVTVMPTKLEE